MLLFNDFLFGFLLFKVLSFWIYVVHAAVIWHIAAHPYGLTAGTGSADISHHSTVCFLQEQTPYGSTWMEHATIAKTLSGEHKDIPIKMIDNII